MGLSYSCAELSITPSALTRLKRVSLKNSMVRDLPENHIVVLVLVHYCGVLDKLSDVLVYELIGLFLVLFPIYHTVGTQ